MDAREGHEEIVLRWMLVHYGMRVGGGWNFGVAIPNSVFLASLWLSSWIS